MNYFSRLLSCAATLLLVCSFVSSQQELCHSFVKACERDEFVVGGKRMVLFSKEKSWQDAKEHCESLGMKLLATPTKNEVDLLKTYLNSRIWDGRPDVQFWNLWLGASDLKNDGEWLWSSTGRNLTYTTWAKDEPNGGTAENCLELKLIYFDESWWNDSKCHFRKRYICELEDGGLNK